MSATALETSHRHVSGGELREVQDMLPQEIRQLWPAPSMAPAS